LCAAKRRHKCSPPIPCFATTLGSTTPSTPAKHSHPAADGLALYTHKVPIALGTRCDFAQLVKTYKSEQQETRYSPATITSIEKIARFGNPDEALISTSYSERFNLTVRMQNRRMTRLTNAHSKKAEHHAAMMSLTTAFYNFCRKHESLKGRTPAQAAGLTDRVWTLKELLAKVA
jgi:hypothetical protein